jgi:Putative prokaryotic signal transducing protein
MSDALVTVSTYRQMSEAQVARTALEAAGIPSVISSPFGESTALQSLGAGIRLQVHAEDAEDADAVLNHIHGVSHAEFVRPSATDDAEPPSRCELCGSPDVQRVNKLLVFAVVAPLVAALFGYLGQQTLIAFYAVIVTAVCVLVGARWKCRNCGHRWS